MLNNIINIDKDRLNNFAKEFQNEQNFCLRWLTKFDKLSKEQRAEIIQKIVNKYSSDKYIDSEYKKGYEPRCSLYNLLFDYGMQCGKSIEYCQNVHFPEEQYLIDDSILVAKVYGQGEYIYVEFLEENYGLRVIKNDFHNALQSFLRQWSEKINGEYTIKGTFNLDSHRHIHQNGHCEKFTIDSFKFEVDEPTITNEIF